MRKFSLLLGSMVILALAGPAVGQYVPPPGVWVPQNPVPPPVNTTPGYRWREQQRYQNPQPNDNAVQDTRRLEQQQRSLNETAGRRATDPGECALDSLRRPAKGADKNTTRRKIY